MRGLLAAVALLSMSASTGLAQEKNWKKELEQQLVQQLVPTEQKNQSVTQPGIVLVANADGIPASFPTVLNMFVDFAKVRNGRVTNPQSDGVRLERGDKLYVQSVSVGDNNVDVRLFTVEQVRYKVEGSNRVGRFKAAVRFEFDKGVLPKTAVADIERAIEAILPSEPAFVALGISIPPKPTTRATGSPVPVVPSFVDLRVGDKVPDFSLPDMDGKTYRLSDYKGKAVVLVWFSPTIRYEGSMITQIGQCRGLRDGYQYLKEMNAAYFMVSVNPPADNRRFVDESCPGANFPVLSDLQGAVAAAYGVLQTASGIDRGRLDGSNSIVPRGGFVYGSVTYIGPDGILLHKEEREDLRLSRGWGRDVAIKLRDLGIKTVAEAAAPVTQPKTIELGQTIAQVEAILGRPETIVNLGAKTTYVYKSLKVIFTNGKVTDVQ